MQCVRASCVLCYSASLQLVTKVGWGEEPSNYAILNSQIYSAVSNILQNVSFYCAPPPPPLWFLVHPSLLYLLLFLLTHPCFVFSLPLSLNELPLDYWGLWRSIRNMCEGLEAADGKSSFKQLTLISPKEPEPAGKKNSQQVQRHKIIAFWQDIIFHWMNKQEKTCHPKLVSQSQLGKLDQSPSFFS